MASRSFNAKTQMPTNSLVDDEKSGRWTDTPVTLDLDDAVKVSYVSFVDFLAELKVVTGGGVDE